MTNVQSREDRFKTLASFYKADELLIHRLALLAHDHRKARCQEAGFDPHIFRTMIDYTRFREAEMVHEKLSSLRETIASLAVLDFGCLVADYGLYFARLGAPVAIYDTAEATEFALFRLAREGLQARRFTIPTDYATLLHGINMAIFGEVLEHLDSPLDVLQSCVSQNVKYIFTSCYPYGDDSYFEKNGHSASAQAQQPACIDLLTQLFTRWPLKNKAVLWQRRPTPGE